MSSRKFTLIALATVTFFSGGARAYPLLSEGDTWTYLQTTERGQSTPQFTVAYPSVAKTWVVDYRNPNDPSFVPRITHSIDQLACVVDILGGTILLAGEACEVPLRPGQAWNRAESNASGVVTYEYACISEEEISVPAGKFLAIKISEKRSVQPAGGERPRTFETLFWYSPQIRGMVRVERMFPESDTRPVRTTIEVLKAYSAP